MTEDEAQAWLRDTLDVSRETMNVLDVFRQMVIAESTRQNLISAATVDRVWARHIVDSAQLLLLHGAAGPHPERPTDRWLDLGTGAGLPGIVVAILRPGKITLVESRRLRAAFLEDVVKALGLKNVKVANIRVELMPLTKFRVISARAFAPLPRLFALAQRFSGADTLWLLPKGKSAQTEVESVARTWHGSFHVKPSITDPNAAIIVAEGVRPVGKR